MLLKFRLLRFPDIFLKPCLMKLKRGNLEVSSSTSTSALDSLVVEVSESRLFSSKILRAPSTCCILSFSFIGETNFL